MPFTFGKAKTVSRRHELRKLKGSTASVSAKVSDQLEVREIEWYAEKDDDATETEAYIDGVTGERYTLESEQVLGFECYALIVDSDTLDTVFLKLIGCIKRDSSDDVAMIGRLFKQKLHEDFTGWSLDFEADNSNKALIVKVTGISGKNLEFKVTS